MLVERPRIPVVGEDHAGRDHDPIGDGDPGGDVDHRVDLDEVADLDAVGDVRLLADDAIVADRGGAADVHMVPHRGSISDANAILDHGSRVDARHVACACAAHACALRRAAGSPAIGMSAHSTATQPPERSERYDASTAATVGRHSPGEIHGVRAPASTSTNARIMLTWDACRS